MSNRAQFVAGHGPTGSGAVIVRAQARTAEICTGERRAGQIGTDRAPLRGRALVEILILGCDHAHFGVAQRRVR